MRRRCIPAAAALAAALTVPGLAEAKITVGQGIGPVKIRQTKTQVRQELGKPDRIYDASTNPDVYHQRAAEWSYGGVHPPGKKRSYQILFNAAGRVSEAETNDSRQTTDRGVGTLSSDAAVKRAYPGIHCFTNPLGSGCEITNGQVETVFSFGSSHYFAHKVLDVSVYNASIDPTLRYVH